MISLLAQIAAIDPSPLPNVQADSHTIQTIFKFVLALAGAMSFLMVAIGGFRYVLSRGDPQATAKAKNTILYALIGLVICITAFGIVAFVLGSF